MRVPDDNKRKNKLDKIVKSVKASWSGHDYDCIIGVVVGLDSTYLAYLVKEFTLDNCANKVSKLYKKV